MEGPASYSCSPTARFQWLRKGIVIIMVIIIIKVIVIVIVILIVVVMAELAE